MKEITDLFNAWCESTSQELNERATERLFYEAHIAGITPDDLKVAVKFMILFNNKSDGAKFRLNAFKVLSNLDSLAALVAEARAKMRNTRKPPTAAEKVKQDYEQVIDPEEAGTMTMTPGRTLKDVLRTMAN